MTIDRFGRTMAGMGLGLALGAAASRADMPPERMFQTVEAGPGIVAFIAAETNGPIPSGNVVAVIGDDGVLVVDSGRFPTLARRMIAEIRKRTDKPVRYLVHTHWHLDHIAADGEFQKAYPGIQFVTTEFTRRKMLEKQAAYLRDVEKNNAGYVKDLQDFVAAGKRSDGKPLTDDDRRYLLGQVTDIQLETRELAGAKLVEPDVTFARELRVYLGGREVRIAFLGDGNTAGDTVTFVPDAKVAVVGDLLVYPIPYGYGCHPAEWIQTLQKLMATDVTTIVPGHGPVHARLVLREEGDRAARIDPRAGRRGRAGGRDDGGDAEAGRRLELSEAVCRRERCGRPGLPEFLRLFRRGPRLPGGEGTDGRGVGDRRTAPAGSRDSTISRPARDLYRDAPAEAAGFFGAGTPLEMMNIRPEWNPWIPLQAEVIRRSIVPSPSTSPIPTASNPNVSPGTRQV